MPAERMRLCAWIKNKCDSAELPGLEWEDREKRIFKVAWKHASRQCWRFHKDACVFEGWALHSGRYRPGIDKPDPRRWKANFRCALNALPDIRELPNKGIARGQDAYKVYQIVVKNEKGDEGHSKRGQTKANTSSSTASNSRMVVPSREHSGTKRSRREHAYTGTKKNRTMASEPPRKAPYYHLSSKPFSGFGYWPTFHGWPPHLVDHDYMNTWFDPRPVMEDKGIMAQPGIKQEPLSPGNGMIPSSSHEIDLEEGSSEVAKVIVKEEDEVPSEQEIIDLVDQMEEESNSSFEDLDSMDGVNDGGFTQEHSSNTERPPLQLVLKTEGSSSFDGEYGASLPLTPDSTREILSVISNRC